MPGWLLPLIAGIAFTAAGTWVLDKRSRRGGRRTAQAFVLCAFGVGIIVFASVGAAPNTALRIALAGMYSAAGAFIGIAVAAIQTNRSSGPVLASLGSGTPTGFMVVSLIAFSVGAVSLVMRFLIGSNAGFIPLLVGQSLYFLAFAVWAVLRIATKWKLTEKGIVGPGVFLPWQGISTYQWQDPDTLLIGDPPLRIRVSAEARQQAIGILDSKLRR